LRLVWARFALSDREDIFTHIEVENPRAAVHIDQQIVLAARRLLDFPESGRPGRIAGTRELVVSHTPDRRIRRDGRHDSHPSRPAWRSDVARRDSHGVVSFLFRRGTSSTLSRGRRSPRAIRDDFGNLRRITASDLACQPGLERLAGFTGRLIKVKTLSAE
jgi:plasmid stabilization system protein ParE